MYRLTQIRYFEVWHGYDILILSKVLHGQLPLLIKQLLVLLGFLIVTRVSHGLLRLPYFLLVLIIFRLSRLYKSHIIPLNNVLIDALTLLDALTKFGALLNYGSLPHVRISPLLELNQINLLFNAYSLLIVRPVPIPVVLYSSPVLYYMI